MKKLFFLVLGASVLLSVFGCEQKPGASTSDNDVSAKIETVDSLAIQLHRIDSLFNSGKLLHMDIYKLEKLKSIEFSVQSISVEGDSFEYINLRKDCGGEYYYNFVDARILVDEVKYLLKAIDTIKSNLQRETNHEERYAYITKDDIRLFATNDGGGSKWKVYLSVDFRKDNSEIMLSETDLSRFVALLKQGVEKIEEVSE